MFELINDLPDINPSDQVYRHQESGQLIKVRLLRLPVNPDATAEAQRNMRSFLLSASLCNEQGRALADGELGYQIAPAETLAVQLQGLADRAREKGISVQDQLWQEIEDIRLKLCRQAIEWRALNDLMAEFVPAPVESANS